MGASVKALSIQLYRPSCLCYNINKKRAVVKWILSYFATALFLFQQGAFVDADFVVSFLINVCIEMIVLPI